MCNIKARLLSALLLLVVVISVSLPANAEDNSKPVFGYKIPDYMSDRNITPQKAYDDLVKLEIKFKDTNMPHNKPQLLYDMAKYKIYLGLMSYDVNYAKKHLDDYYYNEIGGDYIYKGKDLKEIMDNYPDSLLADDAAFMHATLPQGGECEGDIRCYMQATILKYEPFFDKYSDSPYTVNAINEINDTLKLLEERPEYAYIVDEDKPNAVELCDTYNKMLGKTAKATRIKGLYPLAMAYFELDANKKAEAILDEITDNYPDFKDMDLVTGLYRQLYVVPEGSE